MISMCGRYTLTTPLATLWSHFGLSDENMPYVPRYNVAPTQDVVTITNEERPRALYMRWGLVPAWAKDIKAGAPLINAKAEGLAASNIFKRPFLRHRCLVLADGFYEWRQEGKTRIPVYFRLKSGAPFAFAGLWGTWNAPMGQTVHSCCIITTEPNPLVEAVHNRMPVILPSEAEADWIAPGPVEAADLVGVLAPYPSDLMEAFDVSPLVNNVRNDSAECVVPARRLL